MSKKMWWRLFGALTFLFGAATALCWFAALFSGVLGTDGPDYTTAQNWLFAGSIALPILTFIMWVVWMELQSELEKAGVLERNWDSG